MFHDKLKVTGMTILTQTGITKREHVYHNMIGVFRQNDDSMEYGSSERLIDGLW